MTTELYMKSLVRVHLYMRTWQAEGHWAVCSQNVPSCSFPSRLWHLGPSALSSRVGKGYMVEEKSMATPGLTRKKEQRPSSQEPSAAGWVLEQTGAGHTQDQLSAIVAPQPGGRNHGCNLGHCVSMRGSLTAELTLWYQPCLRPASCPLSSQSISSPP